MIKISPSVLSADFLDFKKEIETMEKIGVDMLHLDVMDGIFVPNISFGNPLIKSIKAHTNLPLDVHLMIDRPHRYIEDFAKYADILGFHFEAGSDNAEGIYDLLPLCDMVLVMSVEPGFGGQKYLQSATEKLKKLRAEIDRLGLDCDLEVDGGINGETAKEAIDAGANVIVAGSYLVGSPELEKRVEYLKAI